MQSIEIDWDIHQAIEAERRGFDEPPNLALRRLLKLPPPPASVQATAVELGGLPWAEEGVVIPSGAKARMPYQRGKQVFEGEFRDARLVVQDRSFDTLSAAASGLARTKKGTSTNLNGWKYWQVQLPGETCWKPLSALRRAARIKASS